MAWPTTNPTTTYLDQDTDDITQARAELKDAVDQLNNVINARNAGSGIPSLDANSAVTEWQLRQLRTPVVKTANYTVVDADNGRIFLCEGAITFTVDDTIAQTGTNYTVKNANLGNNDSSVTISISGGSSLEGETTITLRPGDGMTIVRGSNEWVSLEAFRADAISGTDYSQHRFIYFNREIMESGTGWTTLTTDITEVTWESVGGTGSGADNIWTALDDVPELTGYIMVQGYATAKHTGAGGLVQTQLYARPYNSTDTATWENLIVEAAGYGTSTVDVTATGVKVIPIDSNRRFELYWDEFTNNSATAIYLQLVGFMN